MEQELLRAAEQHRGAGNYQSARSTLRSLIKCHPTSVQGYLLLARIAAEHQDWVEAESCAQQARFLEPENAQATLRLGTALRHLGRPKEAVAVLEQAQAHVENASGDVRARLELALACQEAGEFEQAETVARTAAAGASPTTMAREILARVLIARGQFQEAAQQLAAAAEQAPSPSATALLSLATIGQLPDQNAPALEAALASDELSLAERRDIGFGLGKALDDKGRYEEAFAAYRVANRAQHALVRRSVGSYSRKARAEQTDALIRRYTPESLQAWSGKGIRSPQPVLIVGMPRSGTTLIERILAAHPQVHGAGELQVLPRLRHEFERIAVDGNESGVSRIPKPLVEHLARRYLAETTPETKSVDRVVDKNPHNFENLGLLQVLLPEATIVHCWRDPLDTCLSNYFQAFSLHHAHNNQLDELGHYFGEYARLMTHWYGQFRGNIHRVVYEELVRSPETAVRSMLDACGLDFHPACLAFHQASGGVNTPSQYQVRQGLYTRSVGRARHYQVALRDLANALDAAGIDGLVSQW